MREIKFRGLNPHGKWFTGSLFVNEKGETFIDRFNWQREPIRPDTVGGFTGFKDASGVDIFEGDIVSFDHTLMTVEWWDTKSRFIFWQRGWQEVHDISSEAKILGNVHEHPHLLNLRNVPRETNPPKSAK